MKGKTRLLAGFMAAVLLSTTCLGGVSAAGEEGITTLNASVTEDESTTWNATVTAGETLFPEGTELRFAVADEEKKAAVQEQLMTDISAKEENTEEDTTAGKTLQDLHVYDFGLADADGAEIDYTDKVTYSVKSASAADTDTDATDYVIYRVNEEEDSGEGATVTLEPIENSTGTVKLDGSGWMTEFSVETEPVERIAVAVYKTAAAETDESSEEEDGTEEEESAGDVGVSTFAVNVNQEERKIADPTPYDITDYAPMNRLMILDNMDGAKVEVIGQGSHVCTEANSNINGVQYIEKSGEIYGNTSANDYMSNGDFWGWNNSTQRNEGPAVRMYSDMCSSTNPVGGVAILFTGSNENTDNYKWDYTAGWDANDLTLGDSNQMWVQVEYTNVGYYNGRLINAIATIKVTPSKNRNPSNVWYSGDYNETNNRGYSGVYNPMIQLSASLYRGWVWQNVEKFHINIQFYYTSDTNKTPIQMNAPDDPYNNKDFGTSMYTTFYTINSLNPSRNTYWERRGENPERYIGAEYVLPTQDIKKAYVMADYEDPDLQETLSSNIRTSFNGWTDSNRTELQYAYNGGYGDENPWGWMGRDSNYNEIDDNKDAIGNPGWTQNSVTLIPDTCTRLSFTMGKMAVNPNNNEYDIDQNGDRVDGSEGDLYPKNYTQATDIMWATISTRPFAQTRVPININVTKSWEGLTNTEKEQVGSITVQLWLQYNSEEDNDNPRSETQLREITITPDENGDWNGTFDMVGDAAFYEANGYYNPVYILREVKVTDLDGEDITGEFTLSGTTTIVGDDIARVDDDSYEINQSFEITNTKSQTGSVTINKKAIDAGGERELPGVEFTLQAALVSGDTWTPDMSQDAYSEVLTTNQNGTVSFDELAEGNYLLTETKTASGYTLLKDPVRITIPYVIDSNDDTSNSPVTGSGVSQNNGEVWYYDLTYTITNGQSFDLPQTGGTSADRIMRTGMVLFATAAGALLYLNRKRRREQQKN